MVKVLVPAVLIALAGCQTTKGNFCAIAQPQRPSQATINAMTDAEVAQALAALEKGKRLCGWSVS